MSATTAFLFTILSVYTIYCTTAADTPSKGDRGDPVTSESVSSTGTKDLAREATGWERPTYGTQTWYPPQGNNKGGYSRGGYTGQGYQGGYQQGYPSTSNAYGRNQGSYVPQNPGRYPGNLPPPGYGNNKGGWSSAGSGWSDNYGRPSSGGHAQGNYKGGSTINQGWQGGSRTGYGGGQSGYPGGQSGYPGGQSGYPGGQSGYPGGQSGYAGGQSGYGGGQSGYGVGQGGYGVGQSGYGVGQSGYGVGQSGYGVGQSGYGVGQSGYGDGWYGGNQIRPSGSYNWPSSSGYRGGKGGSYGSNNWGHTGASSGGYGNQGLNTAGVGNQIYGSGYGGAYPAVNQKGWSGSGYGNTIPTHGGGWGTSAWESYGYQTSSKGTPRINNVYSKGWSDIRPNYGNYPNNKAWW